MMGEAGDPYALMARYYDAENAGLVEDFPAYEALVERFSQPVLDVGCGTGRIAFHLVRRGVQVVGVDHSTSMLVRARERAIRQQFSAEQIEFVEADAAALALGRRFRLALMAFNTFMHFTEQEQQIAVLRRVAEHLEPDGGLALDLPNPIEMFRADDVPMLVLERTFTDPQTGHLVMQQSVAHLDRAAQIMEVTWVYDCLAHDGTVTRTLVPLRLRYTFAPELRLLLAQTGFGAVECYGDYDFAPYQEDSPRLFVVAARLAK